MSRPPVETVKRVYDIAAAAWRSDVPAAALVEVYDPDVVIQERADFPDRDTYQGYSGLTRWWRGFQDIYEDVQIEPLEFIEHHDRVVVRVRQITRSKGGVVLEDELAHVFTVRDGLVSHITGYNDVEQALRAVRGESS